MFNTSLLGGSEETLLRIARIDEIGVKDGVVKWWWMKVASL